MPSPRSLVLLMAILPTGCGIAAKVQARDDMMAAKKAYTDCIVANATSPNACQAQRAVFDVDMEAYRATSAGIQGGSNNTLTVNASPPKP